ncbi:hypothetical protein M426DRAFT_113209 [Hypoxylon sp. CI-4A]|nr:hypothetical protein M426DRAFT_113209 [Hypoxylon sp. CI-4A]
MLTRLLVSTSLPIFHANLSPSGRLAPIRCALLPSESPINSQAGSQLGRTLAGLVASCRGDEKVEVGGILRVALEARRPYQIRGRIEGHYFEIIVEGTFAANLCWG